MNQKLQALLTVALLFVLSAVSHAEGQHAVATQSFKSKRIYLPENIDSLERLCMAALYYVKTQDYKGYKKHILPPKDLFLTTMISYFETEEQFDQKKRNEVYAKLEERHRRAWIKLLADSHAAGVDWSKLEYGAFQPTVRTGVSLKTGHGAYDLKQGSDTYGVMLDDCILLAGRWYSVSGLLWRADLDGNK